MQFSSCSCQGGCFWLLNLVSQREQSLDMLVFPSQSRHCFVCFRILTRYQALWYPRSQSQVIWKLVTGVTVGVLVVWTRSFQGEAGGWFYCSSELTVDSRGCAHQIFQASRGILVPTWRLITRQNLKHQLEKYIVTALLEKDRMGIFACIFCAKPWGEIVDSDCFHTC